MPTPTEFLARGCTFELDNGTPGSPDWVTIGNISKWSHSPKANDADTTTFDDAGRMSHMKASRGDEFTFTGLAQEDPDDGTRDAGQLACEAWGRLIGPSSRKPFRVTTPGGNTLEFDATATVTLGGGGNDDPNTWELAIVVSGDVDSSVLPALPNAPTSADATAANDSLTATWTNPTIGGTPDAFEIVVYLDADDSEVTSLTVSGASANVKPVTVNGLANATAYYFRVRARNAAGWGPYSADSDTITTT